MRTSQRGMIELACHEGVSTQMYYDIVGVPTIGIGATASEIPNLASWPTSDSMSIPDVFELFSRSLEKYEDAVSDIVKVSIAQQQFDALVSFTYNVGCSGFQRSALAKDINAAAPYKTIYDDFLKWSKPKAIVDRRTKEALLYKTCEYQTDGIALLYETYGTGRIKRYKTINLFPYFS